MKICVFGSGAVGSHLAVKLVAAGNEVSVVSRGAQLAAIRELGLTLKAGERTTTVRVAASSRPEELGRHDAVIVSLKAPAVSRLGEALAPLLGAETPIVFAQNGVPWWYPIRLKDRPTPPDLSWLDPEAKLAAAYADRALGGVIFSSNEIAEPGVVVNDSPERNMLIIGELDDADTERVRLLRATLAAAGLESPAVPDLRRVLWTKLVGNMTVSTMCMLTGLTALDLVRDPHLARAVGALGAEARAVSAAHGYALEAPRGPRTAPNHKPSILQDYELGREMEIDALVTAPLAFARAVGVATPTLDLMAGLAVRRATEAGLYAPGPEAAALFAES